MEKENYPVKTAKKWLDGWSKIYENQFNDKKKLKELNPLSIHYPIQLAYYYIDEENEGKKAIDLATGDGRVACFLAQQGYDVEAIDALESSIELTSKRAESLGLKEKVNPILGDIGTYSLRKEGYDFISAMQCLQYLGENARARLKDLKNAVKKEGFLTYSGNIEPHFDTDPPLKPFFITRKELLEMFKGWTILSIGSEERLLRKNDRRGYTWIVAKNIAESEIEDLNVK